MKQIRLQKKQRIAELKEDLSILNPLLDFKEEKAYITKLEQRTGKNVEGDIIPVLHKYDLYIHINNSELSWKPTIKSTVKSIEHDILNQQEWIKKNSFLHNPNPWLLRICSGILIAITAFFLGKYFG